MKILVLCSGGLKSAFLIALARKETKSVTLLHFDHGQASEAQELKACQALARYYDCELIPYQFHLPEGWPIFKLTLLFWQGLFYANINSFSEVYYGPSVDDQRTEATYAYLKRIQLLAEYVQPAYDEDGFRLPKVQIEAPLIILDEKRIIRLGNTYRVPWELTWCCEFGGTTHCGICEHCLRRQRAFKEEASIKDPTLYETSKGRQHAKDSTHTGSLDKQSRLGHMAERRPGTVWDGCSTGSDSQVAS